jgi:hypothetical protein
MSPKKSILGGSVIVGAAGLGLLAHHRRRAEPVQPPAARPKPVHRPSAHRKPAQPRSVTSPPAPETHTLRNALLGGTGIVGGIYAASRRGPTWRGGKWRAMDALRPGMIRFERPRTEAGTFAGGDTAGSPADMTAAYGHPQTRPAALSYGLAGGAAVGGAGALTAAALAVLKERKKYRNR